MKLWKPRFMDDDDAINMLLVLGTSNKDKHRRRKRRVK